jgi:ABC-type multidrug transport system fused ATPase/permease subunit
MDFLLAFMREEGQTVVMACHQLHFLHHADLIVTLADSTICEQGAYEDLVQKDRGAFASLIAKYAAASDGDVPSEEGQDEVLDEAAAQDSDVLTALAGAGKAGSLMSLEERKTGSIGFATYRFYASQFTCQQLVPLGLLFLLAQVFRLGMDLWMSRWAIGDTSILPDSVGSDPTMWFAGGYAVFGISTFVFSSTRFLWLQMVAVTASRNMHNTMLDNLLAAPSAFFDVTPVGRICNRFAGDINSLDFTVPVYYHSVMMLALQLLNSLAVVAVMLPPFMLWVLPMAYLNHKLTTKYRNCARELKRLCSNKKSPIFTHFNETINGLITVRAFDAVGAFTAKSGETVDDQSRAQMCLWAAARWLGMRISALGACSIFIAALGILVDPGRLDAGLVGVVMTYAEMVNASLMSFLQNMTEVEILMNAVERVRYFTREVQQEAPYELEAAGPQGGAAALAWPSAGVVSFRNVCARYRPELPRVLNGLSIEVGTAQKVGICGRTGSGKSTLMLLLFRILELDEGAIAIDGIDIASLGLSQLRSAWTGAALLFFLTPLPTLVDIMENPS